MIVANCKDAEVNLSIISYEWGEILVGRLWSMAVASSKADRIVLQNYAITEKELSVLRAAGVGATFSSLGAILAFRPYEISRLASSLERSGYVKVVSSRRDARNKSLRVTAAGRRLILEIDGRVMDRLLEKMPGPYGKQIRVQIASQSLYDAAFALFEPMLFDNDPEMNHCECSDSNCDEREVRSPEDVLQDSLRDD